MATACIRKSPHLEEDHRRSRLIDAFAELPIGVIGGDYSPDGEAHIVKALADTGDWQESVLHHSFRNNSRGNWQIVVENDGVKALEQTIRSEKVVPVLSSATLDWTDFTLDVKIRPLVKDGAISVLTRFVHARKYYAVRFAHGAVELHRRINDDIIVLRSIPCELHPDRYTHLRVVCQINTFTVMIDDREQMQEAGLDTQWPCGGFGFAASVPSRFREFSIEGQRIGNKDADSQDDKSRSRYSTRKTRFPRPMLWKKLLTPTWGTDRALRVGDLDGDGKPELLLAQRTDRLGKDNYSSISGIAAFSFNGDRLWTMGVPNANKRKITSDLCFQIHDLDGDGKSEVVFCRDWELMVADGATGSVKNCRALPEPIQRDRSDLYRILGDSLLFCDLTGSGAADCIILKDRYRNVWALDKNLSILWQHACNTGHYPFARDIDGDGKDEILIGYTLIDHDGTILWSKPFADHADTVALLDLRIDGPASEPCTTAVIAGSDAGMFLVNLQGDTMMQYPIGHAQNVCVAHLLHDSDALQVMVNTFWGAAGITAVFNEQGVLLHDFLPMPYASLLHPVNWVPLSESLVPSDLVLLSTHVKQGGCIDGTGARMILFPNDGHPDECCESRDIDGDGVDEVLSWDRDAIWIYKADVPGRSEANYPRRPEWYNDSNYLARYSLPSGR